MAGESRGVDRPFVSVQDNGKGGWPVGGKKEPIRSAGVVVVRREGGEWRLLLLRAYRDWDFPKGLVEEDEDPLETARRETAEEAGITRLEFRWGKVWKATPPYSGGRKLAQYTIAETDETDVRFSVNPELGRPEHHEYRWVRLSEARDLAADRLQPVLVWVGGLLEGEPGT
ncbi:MAG: NUDIX domain-containing protein [Deltaproteobacteria bacterium]|nr:NUDIX domain-containing protein [Deltaproteobacteria bacterium]